MWLLRREVPRPAGRSTWLCGRPDAQISGRENGLSLSPTLTPGPHHDNPNGAHNEMYAVQAERYPEVVMRI